MKKKLSQKRENDTQKWKKMKKMLRMKDLWFYYWPHCKNYNSNVGKLYIIKLSEEQFDMASG